MSPLYQRDPRNGQLDLKNVGHMGTVPSISASGSRCGFKNGPRSLKDLSHRRGIASMPAWRDRLLRSLVDRCQSSRHPVTGLRAEKPSPRRGLRFIECLGGAP